MEENTSQNQSEETVPVIAFMNAKGVNRRVQLYVLEVNGVKRIVLSAKRLIDKKQRKIVETEMHLSIESFQMLAEVTDYFVKSDLFDQLKIRISEIIPIGVTENIFHKKHKIFS